MKKIISMLIVLCMICTVLMGTMVVNVSASYSKVTNADSTLTHTHTFDATVTKGFDVGEWYLSNGTDSVKLGETADNVSNAGMTFKKIQFDAGELTGIAADAVGLQFRTEVGSANYLSIDATYSAEDLGQQSLSVSGLNQATKGSTSDLDTERVAIFTLYAYSKTTNGEPLVLCMTANGRDSTSHTVAIPAAKLYSEGAPHKIDVIAYKRAGTGVLSGNGTLRAKVYIDGFIYDGWSGAHKWSLATTAKVTETMSVRLTPSEGTLSWNDTEWYVFTPVQGVDDYIASSTNITKGTASNYIFESTVDWVNTGTAGTAKTDVVDDGVNADVEALINNALLTDRCNEIKLSASYYQNPDMIYDNDESTVSNVKIVEKSTGTVYDEENLPPENFTFDNAYLCVEGVYLNVKATYIEYNAEEKTATVSANALPEGTTCQIIVASYDDDCMKSIKVSEIKTATAGAEISYKAEGLLEGSIYKVFVFDSITNSIPLLESIVIEQ